MPFARKPIRFNYSGADLNHAVDLQPPGRCPICENWRQEQDGTMSPRPGLGKGNSQIGGQSNLHSCRRLDDTSSGSTVSTLIVGTGTHIGTVNPTSFVSVDKDSGYSGDPVSLVLHRPPQASKKFMYVGDRSRMKKFDQAGNKKAIGLATPIQPPTAVVNAPQYKAVEEFDDHTQYTIGGTASAKADNTRVNAATRSITAILYDAVTAPGFACVRPSSMADIGKGMRLTFKPATTNETAVVEEVHKGSAAVAFTALTTGVLGEYAIHPTTPIDVDINSMVSFSGTGAYARVKSVYETQDGFKSFMVDGQILAPTGNVQAFGSFRVYLVGTFAAADPLQAKSVQFQVDAGTGSIIRTIALDLSQIASGVQTLPDDLVHLSILIDHPEFVTEVRAYWDIDIATNDCTKNYMQKILRSNDFSSTASGSQTLVSSRQINLQRGIAGGKGGGGKNDSSDFEGPKFREPPIDDSPPPDPTSPNRNDQTDAGQNQYTEAFWRISELTTPDIGRIGADESRGLANVAALKIAVIATATVIVRVDSWWIGGGYGPDVIEGRPIQYRYRFRDSTTGVVSNWSPPSMAPVTPRRQKVTVTALNSGDAEVDIVDFFRYGGVLLGWHFAGSALHSSLVFTDTYPDSDLDTLGALSDQQAEDYQLWPLHSIPITGTITGAVGPLVIFNSTIGTSIAPGTRIRIGQDWHIIQYGKTGTTYFLTDSAGVQVLNTPFEIPDPVLVSQSLPVLAGPFFGFYFGLGDKVNPQRLYYANGNKCDSTREDQFVDIDVEVLQNIVGGEDWALVFTTGGIYSIEPTFGLADKGGNLFRYRRIPGTTGLFAKWAVCVCDVGAAFLGKDGIYYTAGGSPELLTEDLRPIFPHEGNLGVTTNGFAAPNMIAAQKTKMRLSYADNELFFDYIDTSGNYRTIVRRFKPNAKQFGWRPYLYSVGANFHYDEEGEDVHSTLVGSPVDGLLYRLGRNFSDSGGTTNLDGLDIVATMQTPSEDMDDPIGDKYFGHVALKYDTDGGVIVVTPGFNEHGTTLASTNLNEAAGLRTRILDFNSGQAQAARNISLRLVTTVKTARPVLHLWQPAHSPKPDISLLRGEDFKPQGGCVFARGIWITGDTFSVDRSALLEYVDDDGNVQNVTISAINHDVMTTRFYPIAGGIYLYAYRLRPTDANTWELAADKLEGEPAPPLSDGPTEWIDLGGLRFVQGVVLDIDTRNTNVDMQVRVDQDILQTTISNGNNSGPVISNGRAQLAYSFEVPFLTHLIRFDPSARCRIWPKPKIESRPDVELAYMWKSQQTACGLPGWKYFGDGYISVRSTENFRFFIIADGTSYEVTFYDANRNTAGERRRFRYRAPSFIAKSVEFQAYTETEAGRVAIYEQDFAQEIKPWAHEGSWLSINPLGDVHHDKGATI